MYYVVFLSRSFVHGSGASEDDGVEHGGESLDDVGRHDRVDLGLEVLLGVLLAHTSDEELLRGELILLDDGVAVGVGESLDVVEGGDVLGLVRLVPR